MDVKISIVLPVYNDEKTIGRCVESILNNTLKQIEVICIDDGSTDNTFRILCSYRADERFHLIQHHSNLSTLQSRKHGILLSKGKYIMFADGDDWFSKNAFEVAYNYIQKCNVDILHFNAEILNCGVSSERCSLFFDVSRPFCQRLSGKSVFTSFCEGTSFNHFLWNKIYKTDVCKKAATYMSDRKFYISEDFYMFFLIAYFADSYIGVSTDNLYHYCFGAGIIGDEILSRHILGLVSQEALLVKMMQSFLATQSVDKTYSVCMTHLRDRFLQRHFSILLNRTSLLDAFYFFRRLRFYWGENALLHFLDTHDI